MGGRTNNKKRSRENWQTQICQNKNHLKNCPFRLWIGAGNFYSSKSASNSQESRSSSSSSESSPPSAPKPGSSPATLPWSSSLSKSYIILAIFIRPLITVFQSVKKNK